ncbi:MAG TPA: anion transporter [Rhodospirillaceae bacterium]|nr:anion transporter [Magnetovibrio sp.]HBT40470.1 anion transporter [Rhodospirillaceae bacterium]
MTLDSDPPPGPVGARPAAPLVGLVAGPALCMALAALPAPEGLGQEAWLTAGVAVWMAVWWLTQAVPLAVTALLPVLLFPVLGVAKAADAAQAYAHPLVFLFLGGFVIALTIERWNLHRRVAITIVSLAGVRPDRLIGGFMLATAGLSMWVSNTATTLMMVPIGLSVVAFIESHRQDGMPPTLAQDRFARGLLLAIAYAASIGGTATLIGTPPNAFLAGYLAQNHGVDLGFARWMLLGIPLATVMLLAAWLLLTRVLYPAEGLDLARVAAGIAAEKARLAPPTRGEAMTAILFAAVALAWVFQPLIADVVPVSDTAIALTGAVAAFAIPVNLKKREFLMDWDHAVRLPWGILILLGGGFSLAEAIQTTGLAAWLGHLVAGGSHLPLILLLLAITGLVVFLTEITSNTATAAVFIPVAATLAVSMGFDAVTFAVPVAMAASCAFMMPVATPPNAIVFAAGRLDVMHMCAAGIFLNLIATVMIAGAALVLVPLVFG